MMVTLPTVGSGCALGLIIPGMQGHFELLIILVIVLLLFGGKKIPEVAKGLGRGIREFKKARHEIDEEVRDLDADLQDRPAPRPSSSSGPSKN